MELHTFHLFAGAGGGILADMLLGHKPVGAVEIETYPRSVLLQRQLDGCLPRFPVWDDIKTFRSDNPDTSGYIQRLVGFREKLCISGGFPCQDISAAGKGAGIGGERSGLWGEMARIIREIRPRYAFVENSPLLVGRGLAVVLGDFAEMGYDARWGIVGAHHAAAPHKRDRIWIVANSNRGDAKCGQGERSRIWAKENTERTNDNISGSSQRFKDVAYADCERKPQPQGCEQDERQRSCDGGVALSHANGIHDDDGRYGASREQERESSDLPRGSWWDIEPNVGRVVNGLAFRLDRLASIGNGQVPMSAALAWNILTDA